MSEQTTIDFIRHGEPEGGRLFRGHSVDDPLSEKGWQQMLNAVSGSSCWDKIISSPMSRCHAFAEYLSDKQQIKLAIDDRYKEVGFGSWEGKAPQDLETFSHGEYRRFYADPVNQRPQGAEPLEAFAERVVQAFEQTIEEHRGRHVLVIAHAGVIRAVLGYVMQAEPLYWYRSRIDPAGISRFSIGSSGPVLVFHNRKKLT